MKNSSVALQMPQVSLNEISKQWERVARRARREPTQIIYKGKPSALMLVSRADYDRMSRVIAEIEERLEDKADIALCVSREDEMEKAGIPLDEVLAELKHDGKI